MSQNLLGTFRCRIAQLCIRCLLQERATKWQSGSEVDGLITNGVLIMHPRSQFGCTAKGGSVWREVSVGGGIYALRESRSVPQKSSLVSSEILFCDISLISN